jgi:protein ImuB
MTNEQAAAENERIFAILLRWGIHTVGDFVALDKAAISLRFGAAGVRLWERANGTSTRLLRLVQAPESFEESYEFEHEVETIDPLLFILRRFLEQIATRLSIFYLVTEQLTLRITFDNRDQYHRVFKIPQPTNDVDLLFRVLHTHLENFKSDYPLVAVSLEAHPAQPPQQQFGLFETALRNPMQLAETLARLVALLGPDRVGTPVIEDTHQTDAFHLEPFQWDGEAMAMTPRTPSAHPSPAGRTSPATFPERRAETFRPSLRRFRPNHSAAVLLDQAAPVHVRSTELNGAVSVQAGPYLISGNWWDENNWARAEWDVELNSGALLRCHEESSGWGIDGLYD